MPQINGVVVDDDGCVDTPEGKKAHVAALHLIPKAQHEAEMALSAKLAPARAAKAALAVTDAKMTYNEERALLVANPGKDKLTQWEKDTIAEKQAARDTFTAALALLTPEEQAQV